ncbi:MAG: hypothetical protein KGJ06_08700, partial [Pseudomonadota bacterium]|nr:hypothetical protein [Pseudomonadota bacterium]
PTTATEIINRLNEITFNSSLSAEMRAIDFVSRMLAEGRLDPERYKDMHVHLIYSANHMHHLNASSKMNADWDFFLFLKDIGRHSAEYWLKTHWKDVGHRSTVDIRKKFLCGPQRLLDDGGSEEKSENHKQQRVKQRKDK